MKIKLLIISILFTIVLTGCKAEYSLEIKDGIIKETLNGIEKPGNIDSDNKDSDGFTFLEYAKLYGEEKSINTNYYAFYSQEECTEGCTYYDKDYINDDENVKFTLSHDFGFEDYEYSSITNEMLPKFSVSYDNGILMISGGSSWEFLKNYKFLSELNINIKTNYKVLSTNLEKESDGVYVWKINNSNINENKELYIYLDTKNVIEIKDSSEVEKEQKKEQEKNYFLKILAIVVICVFVIILFKIVFRKEKEY